MYMCVCVCVIIYTMFHSSGTLHWFIKADPNRGITAKIELLK